VLVKCHSQSDALADFQRALACGASLDSLAWLEWAQTLVALKRPAEALAVLDQGIQQTGAVSTLQVYAVDLELTRNNTGKALSRLQTIIDNAERKERWLARRGDIQMASGDRLSARESYAAAIAAIKRLPKILQVSPAMVTLKTQMDTALAGITGSPAISKVGVR
jgi:predicted negative regulator of RcsB-dependent stress response